MPLFNQLSGAKELSILAPSRSMSTAMGLQNWLWKKLTLRLILTEGPWNISSMESLVMSGINMESKWMAGTKQPSWPTIGAVILAYLKIPIHTMITIPMTGLCNGCESSLVTTPVPIAQLAWLLHSILCQDPAGNDSILSALSTASPV
jgi:hypothetical protein